VVESSVRAVLVVVPFEHTQGTCRVPLVDDQDTVEELATDGADEALGDRIRMGAPVRVS
jgi:hypothetical protein